MKRKESQNLWETNISAIATAWSLFHSQIQTKQNKIASHSKHGFDLNSELNWQSEVRIAKYEWNSAVDLTQKAAILECVRTMVCRPKNFFRKKYCAQTSSFAVVCLPGFCCHFTTQFALWWKKDLLSRNYAIHKISNVDNNIPIKKRLFFLLSSTINFVLKTFSMAEIHWVVSYACVSAFGLTHIFRGRTLSCVCGSNSMGVVFYTFVVRRHWQHIQCTVKLTILVVVRLFVLYCYYTDRLFEKKQKSTFLFSCWTNCWTKA